MGYTGADCRCITLPAAQVRKMEEKKSRLMGSCLCGGVRISVPDHFAYFGSCHCSQCRKFSGSAFSTVAGIPYEDFEVVSGENNIKYFAKSESGTLAFCGDCGSSLYGKRSDIRMIHLRAGILDDVPSQKPSYHVFGANLTTSQAFIVSTLYCFVAAVTIRAFRAWAERAFDYLAFLESSGLSSIDIGPAPTGGSILTAIMFAGALACLKFMWDVRHPKIE